MWCLLDMGLISPPESQVFQENKRHDGWPTSGLVNRGLSVVCFGQTCFGLYSSSNMLQYERGNTKLQGLANQRTAIVSRPSRDFECRKRIKQRSPKEPNPAWRTIYAWQILPSRVKQVMLVYADPVLPHLGKAQLPLS